MLPPASDRCWRQRRNHMEADADCAAFRRRSSSSAVAHAPPEPWQHADLCHWAVARVQRSLVAVCATCSGRVAWSLPALQRPVRAAPRCVYCLVGQRTEWQLVHAHLTPGQHLLHVPAVGASDGTAPFSWRTASVVQCVRGSCAASVVSRGRRGISW
jgi:hypothetical protein